MSEIDDRINQASTDAHDAQAMAAAAQATADGADAHAIALEARVANLEEQITEPISIDRITVSRDTWQKIFSLATED